MIFRAYFEIGKMQFWKIYEISYKQIKWDELLQGFTGITDMAGGYAAWVQNGLPSTE